MIEEYSLKTGYDNDLNFALSLNLKVSYFIIDTVKAYTEEAYKDLHLNLILLILR